MSKTKEEITVRKFMIKKYPTDKYMDCPVPQHHWETIQEYATEYADQQLSEARAEIERLKGLIEKAHLEGFKASGEGYNGEYPFEGHSDEHIKKENSFSSYWQQFKLENNL